MSVGLNCSSASEFDSLANELKGIAVKVIASAIRNLNDLNVVIIADQLNGLRLKNFVQR
jgi:hypothetical protein